MRRLPSHSSTCASQHSLICSPTFKFDTVVNLVGSKKLDMFLAKRVVQEEFAASRSFSMTKQFSPLSFTAIGNCYTPPYDSSTKQRIPSWTDRILFKAKAYVNDLDGKAHLIKCTLYNSLMEFHCSDHKPVVASFTLNHGVRQELYTKHASFLKHKARPYRCCAIL